MKKLRDLLSVLLTLLLLTVCLASCVHHGETPPDEPDGPSEPTGPKIDPKELLLSAFDTTEGDLRERFDASRLSKLTGVADYQGLTADFSLGYPDESGEPAGTVSGTLVYDRVSGTASADISLPEYDVAGSLYYSPEFFGVSSQGLLGTGDFYGLRPSGIAEQLDGTPFAQLLKLDTQALAELDKLLDSIPSDIHVYREGTVDAAVRLTRELISGMDLRAAGTSVTRGGSTYDGYDVSGRLSAEALAGYVEELAALIPSLDASGAVSAIRGSGADTPLNFTVADGKLWHVSGEYKSAGSTVYFEAELYGDEGNLVRITVEPYFGFELVLGDDISLAINGSSTTTMDWAADGTLDFITYTNDVTDLALEGTLTAGDDGVSYDGIWFTGNRGDRNALTLSLTPGGTVAVPGVTHNVAEMTEKDLYKMIMGIVFRFAA